MEEGGSLLASVLFSPPTFLLSLPPSISSSPLPLQFPPLPSPFNSSFSLPLLHFLLFLPPLSFLLSIHKLTHRLLSAIPIRELRSLPDSDNLSVAFPDEGAHKRFHCGLQQWPSITCIKVREGDKRVVNIKDGEMRGREERGRGRLLSFPLHSGEDERRLGQVKRRVGMGS